MPLTCFKAYDIRGRMPDEINDRMMAAVARAFFEKLRPKLAIVGGDVRADSPRFSRLIAAVLSELGCEVKILESCGTEEVYFHTADQEADLGLMVTASHNPIDYNGLKYVGKSASPLVDKKLMAEIKARTEQILEAPEKLPSPNETSATKLSKERYISKLLSFVKRDRLKPYKLLVNSGNGAAGAVIDLLEPHLPFEFIRLHHKPDPSFPNGIPNPLLPERRKETRQAVVEQKADMGIAFDGDFDRCFFFDHLGRFVEGYYLVGLLAKAMLANCPRETIVYDPRLTWATQTAVKESGGTPVISISGHSFMKQAMRDTGALYGGELSAHHYFRDFAFCDSGMLPWLKLCEYLSTSEVSLAEQIDDMRQAFPCSDELNFRVSNANAAIEKVVEQFGAVAKLSRLDGLSLEFPDWRMNVRASNTEPLLRLNIETRGDARLLKEKIKSLTTLLSKEQRLE